MSTTGCVTEPQSADASDGPLREKAREIAQNNIIVDGHIDIPYRLDHKQEDISRRTEGGDFDYVRAREGGLNAPFMSIYVPSTYQETGGAKAKADSLIDMVEGFTEKWPDKFAIATSPDDVRRQFEQGLMSLPLGIENGAAIEDNLENLQHFYDRGVRYITLTHATDNLICDSSYDTTRTWNGLSPFGREVVTEMARLGIMIDISHVSDSTFYQVVDMVDVPVIASHSSCRHFTPGWERNMNDDQIRRLAEQGGIIMISFGSSFLTDSYRQKRDAARQHLEQYMEEHDLKPDDPKFEAYASAYTAKHVGYADISDVVNHIDHVVQLVGVDHVGLGSDFDGVGDSLPYGLKDVSDYPNLVYQLLEKGYSEADIEKILGGNLLRIWEEIQRARQEA